MIPYLKYIPYIGAALISSFITWQVSGAWHSAQIKLLQLKIDKVEKEEREICNKRIDETKEIASDLQKRLKSADNRHANAIARLLQHEDEKLQHAITTARNDGASADGFRGSVYEILRNQHVAEKQAEYLITCQGYAKMCEERCRND